MVLWLDQRAKRSRGLGGPQGTASKTLMLIEMSLSVLSGLDELELLPVAIQSYTILQEFRACTGK